MSDENAARRLNSTDEEFLGELNSIMKPPSKNLNFPKVVKVSSRAAFPLGLGHATKYCSLNSAVLIGDAAHRVHPMAGQGVNLGFGDAECLVKCLEENVATGAKFVSERFLQNYESERQRYNVPMMLGIDFFHAIYSIRNPIVSKARNLGVNFVQSNDWLKSAIVNFAAGGK